MALFSATVVRVSVTPRSCLNSIRAAQRPGADRLDSNLLFPSGLLASTALVLAPPVAPASPAVPRALPTEQDEREAALLALAMRLVNKKLILEIASVASAPLQNIGISRERFISEVNTVFEEVDLWNRTAQQMLAIWGPTTLEQLSRFADTPAGKLCMETQIRLRVAGYMDSVTRHLPRLGLWGKKYRAWYAALAPYFQQSLPMFLRQCDQSAAIKHLVRSCSEGELASLQTFFRSDLGGEYIRGTAALTEWSYQQTESSEFKILSEARLKPLAQNNKVRTLFKILRLRTMENRMRKAVF